jgi:hypothetical protein
MMLNTSKRNNPLLILFGLMVASLAGLLLVAPIPQDQTYHQFADRRTLFGIPNFWNVVSNIPFIVVGAAGLWKLRRDPATVVLFTGIFLTGFGSAYYHWNPSDRSLFWDRLPMTLSFMAILSVVVQERVNARVGAVLLWPLLAVALFSLLLWRWTDDLRLYAWVQFFPYFALLFLILVFPPKYSGTSYWIIAAVLYALAKLLEFYDEEVYSAGSILSGHTVKHFAAAAACFAILRNYQIRQPINRSHAGVLP